MDEDEEDVMEGSEEWPLYAADPTCDHEIKLRMSGYGCIKCPGWYCA
jgi:hypothetical protein